MKKIIISLFFLSIVIGVTTQVNAQNTQLSKKEQKAIRKAQEKAAAQQRYEIALKAIQDQAFVLEADKITFKRGQFVYVTSFTNFILVDGENATVQLAFNTARSGPNGIGGITVDGRITDSKIKTNKRGDTIYSFNVQGIGISAQIELELKVGDNEASADVNPTFNSNRMSLSGLIVPLDESTVYKARSL